MTLAPDTRLGRYEIRALLGRGGMGEVYLARDPKLGREVAIKVLPSSFSADAERLARFEQEACAAGALDHPNILVVHDVGKENRTPYVVSELLDGETLREKLSGAPPPQRKALDFATQIARGISAAHERGIVHRDLKPENIFITTDGRAKILDFGLAKLAQADGDQAQTGIPTRRVETDPGAVMGTVGYMAPEQVRGQKVDHRADIFSFGCILYEMLAGRRAFRGESPADTLSAILNQDPPRLSDSNRDVPPELERLVLHCLEKSPGARFQSASDLAFALEAISTASSQTGKQPSAPPHAEPASSKKRTMLVWALAAITTVAALSAAALYFRRAPEGARVLRMSVLLPEKTSFIGTVPTISLSPDGRYLAFVAASEGRNFLWVRALDSLSAQALSGSEGASSPSAPFWSPDGRFVAFTVGGKLKKIDVSGGPPQTLCDLSGFRGGSWNRDGVIVFGGVSGPLYRVSAAGGEPTPVTTLDQTRYETSHRWPYFLPDGRHFLYFVRSNQPGGGGIYVGSLGAEEPKRILPAVINAMYAPPGFLIFMRNEALLAQPFDADKLELTGEPLTVAEKVAYNPGLGRGAFTISEDGMLAFRSGSGQIDQPLWFDRAGKQIGSLGEPGIYFNLWLSPDEKRVAVDRSDPQIGTNDVWVFDLSRGIPSRFTTDPGSDSNPVWSADGRHIIFSSGREGVSNLYRKDASGVGGEEVLLRTGEEKVPDDWSADGRFVVYEALGQKTKWDLWVLPISGDGQPSPFLQSEFNERQAQVSPDGKWIAYTSDESGTPEVYVQTFPNPGSKLRISTGGGSQPKWRRDGRELFYIATDRTLMAVGVKPGAAFEAAAPEPLFATRTLTVTDFRSHYVVTADGQRFLINSLLEETAATPITFVVNWTAGLKR